MKQLTRFVAAALAVVTQGVQVSQPTDDEVPPDPVSIKLPDVPAKAEGLPDIDNLLALSAEAVSSAEEQSSKLQARLAEAQKENSVRLERQKVVFDNKLKEQERENAILVQQNAQIAKGVMQLKKDCTKLRQDALQMQNLNHKRRKELLTLEAESKKAVLYMEKSFKATDDSEVHSLRILTAKPKELPVPTPDLPSLLQVEAEAGMESGDPAAVVPYLAKAVEDVRQQGAKSQAKLKELFLASFKVGVKRHSALLEQHEVLKQTLDSMQRYQRKLNKAKQHVEAMKNELDKRFRIAGLFLSKISKTSKEAIIAK